jgi:hypothetical protein
MEEQGANAKDYSIRRPGELSIDHRRGWRILDVGKLQRDGCCDSGFQRKADVDEDTSMRIPNFISSPSYVSS